MSQTPQLDSRANLLHFASNLALLLREAALTSKQKAELQRSIAEMLAEGPEDILGKIHSGVRFDAWR